MRILKIVFISIFLVLVLPFFVAFLQLNVLAVLLDKNPNAIGIQKDRDRIVASLKENNMVPHVVITDPEKLVYDVANAMSGEENPYSMYVLNVIPKEIILQNKTNDADVMLMDNTLFIVQVQPETFKAIGPVIGHLLIQNSFSEWRIKAYPTIEILQKDEYLKNREYFFAEKLSGVDEEIKKVSDAIKKIHAEIAQDEAMISKNQSVIAEATRLKETRYKKCCTAIRKRLDKEIVTSKKNITDWQTKKWRDTLLLNEYKQYVTFYEKKKELLKRKGETISYETGIFEAEKSIKIALRQAQGELSDEGLDYGEGSEKEKQLAHFWETLIHEYLHYTSYISKGKKLSPFFEEGLTEYFGRKVLDKNGFEYSNNAYPVQVKIIAEMTKKIPEKEFEEIYFEKDEQRLETVLNKAYGKGFYKNNQIVMQTLEYTTDPKEAIKIGNILMKKIGGQPLTESSLQ